MDLNLEKCVMGLSNVDLDEVFLNKLREMPSNRRPYKYHLIQSSRLALPDSLIDELEEILNTRDDETNYKSKDDKFQKFYDEELKSTFKDMLKVRCPIMPTSNLGIVPKVSIKIDESRRSPKLPVFKYTQEIIEAVESNTFVLIKGETGSGKTTQIPQLLLDYYNTQGTYCNIICTQPRRISAVSVAERVAYERNEKIGDSVGYQIRLEYIPPKKVDSILYCTTGVLLRMMMSDPILANVSHVILDEIHERNIDSDLLIGLLQIVVEYNKSIKILLMSATFGFEEYSKHFKNYKIINIEGTLFPVKTFYLEDILNDLQFFNFLNSDTYFQRKHSNYYLTPEGKAEKEKVRLFHEMIDKYCNTIKNKYSAEIIKALKNPFSEEINLNLIERLIKHIDDTMPPGAILVFLPGYDKICQLYDQLDYIAESQNKNYLLYALHSIMPTEDQKGIFNPPPFGTRKIILATNIAETSITIDDVVYVINPGKVKVKHYDIVNKIETLEEYWITKASATQRQGRAGRCQPGICFNLFTKVREEQFEEYSVPEIQRANMVSVIMILKSLKIHDVKEFLKSLISSPDMRTVENGIVFLQKLNALDKDEVLTPLGLHLAHLPIDAQIGKMLLMATIFDCVDPITTIAATLSLTDPFIRPIKKSKEVDEIKLEFSEKSLSDHLVYCNVIKGFREATNDKNTLENFCHENYIKRNTVNDIEKMKNQLCELIQATGFLQYALPTHSSSNKCSSNKNILRAIITSGLYPNIAVVRSVSVKNVVYNTVRKVEHIIQTPEDGIKVKFHSPSVNRNCSDFPSRFLVYFIKHKSGDQIFLRETTMTSPLPIIIFANEIEITEGPYGDSFICTGNNVLRFRSNQRTVHILLKLRRKFEEVLARLTMKPIALNDIGGRDKNVIDALKTLFKEDPFY